MTIINKIKLAIDELELKAKLIEDLDAYTFNVILKEDLNFLMVIQSNEKVNCIRIMVPKLFQFPEEMLKEISEFIMDYNATSIIFGTLALGKTKDGVRFITYSHAISMERGDNPTFNSMELDEYINYASFLYRDVQEELTNERE
ncbi:hypothetical protein ACIQZD_22140 [Peribacillus sp. NPDC096447]|uniref:hypothetical protein n=1 Tax=Peribacillus sp. NPDC096447 TaxID=3364394 RepID=UPI00380909AC